MNAIRRFLADTGDLFYDALRLIGLGGPRWEFRKQALRSRLLGLSADLENVRRGVQAKHKMCRECRALMPVSARACPDCGASTRGVPRGGLTRLISFAFPSFGSLTSVIVTVNFAAYALSLLLAGGQRTGGLLGQLAPDRYAIWMLGAKFSGTIGPPLWQLHRIITANLLHADVVHILMNTIALMNLGPLVEQLIGRRRTLVLYVASGIVAFGASSLRISVSLGASGCIFGLLGFLVVYGRVRGGEAGRMLSAYLMRWVMLSVFLVLVVRIDILAHAGGMAAGALAGLIVRGSPPRNAMHDRLLTLAAAIAVALILAGLAGVALTWDTNRQMWLESAG